MQKFEYFGKEYDIELTQEEQGKLKAAEIAEKNFNEKMEQFKDEEKHPKTEKHFEAVINEFLQYLKEEYTDNPDNYDNIKTDLKLANDELITLTNDYRNVLCNYYGGTGYTNKIYTQRALEEHKFLNEEHNKELKELSKEYVDMHGYYRIDADYGKIMKMGSDKIHEINKIKPEFSNRYKNALKILFPLFEKFLTLETVAYEEGYKKYAAVNLINSQNEVTKYFIDTSNEHLHLSEDPEKRKKFFKQKAKEFNKQEFESNLESYIQEKENYTKLLREAKKLLSSDGIGGNVDVLRNDDTSYLAQEDPIASSALSSAFTMYKMFKKTSDVAKDTRPISVRLDEFFEDPRTLLNDYVKTLCTDYLNSRFDNKNRGQMLSEFHKVPNENPLVVTVIEYEMERFRECMRSINPDNNSEFDFKMNIALDGTATLISSATNRFTTYEVDKHMDELLSRFAILKDDDMKPVNMTRIDYYDLETNEYIKAIDMDDYATMNNVSPTQILNNIKKTLEEYSKEISNELNGLPSPKLVSYALQKFAGNYIVNHYNEMTKKEFEEFKSIVKNPKKYTEIIGYVFESDKYNEEYKNEYLTKIESVKTRSKNQKDFEKQFIGEQNQKLTELRNVYKDYTKLKNKNLDTFDIEKQIDTLKSNFLNAINDQYLNNKVPEKYLLDMVQKMQENNFKEVKGFFEIDNYKNAKEYCEAKDLQDLDQDEMNTIYGSALQYKNDFLSGKFDNEPKINITEEKDRFLSRDANRAESNQKLQEALAKTLDELDSRNKSQPVSNTNQVVKDKTKNK